MPCQRQALGGRDVWVPALLPWDVREQLACGFGGLHNATGTANSAWKKQPDKQQLIGSIINIQEEHSMFYLHFQIWWVRPHGKSMYEVLLWLPWLSLCSTTQNESTVTFVTLRDFLFHFSFGGFMTALGLCCSPMVHMECRCFCTAINRILTPSLAWQGGLWNLWYNTLVCMILAASF